MLVPLTTAEMEGFKAAIATLPQPKKSKSKWKAPADILSALELDIGNLHSQGWNGIPGTRWATYIIKPSESSRPHPTASNCGMPPPTFARFALASNVLPNLTEGHGYSARFWCSPIEAMTLARHHLSPVRYSGRFRCSPIEATLSLPSRMLLEVTLPVFGAAPLKPVQSLVGNTA